VLRLTDGEYQSLETEVLEETDDTVTISAETPGFSVFVVSGSEDPAGDQTPTSTPEPTEPEPTSTPEPTEPEPTSTPEPDTDGSNIWTTIGGVLVLLVVLASALLVARRRDYV
jgi:LPXTG-motif cell wall-anchored protein